MDRSEKGGKISAFLIGMPLPIVLIVITASHHYITLRQYRQ